MKWYLTDGCWIPWLTAVVDEMSARLDEMEAAIKAGNDGASESV